MPSRRGFREGEKRLTSSIALLTAVLVALSACSGPSAELDASHGGISSPGESHSAAGKNLPSVHIHGVARNPGGGELFIATHAGLFRYDKSGPTQVGPVIDLMGFTVAARDHFYASGHPGPDMKLADPAGLIESTDGGRSWSPVSRQGQSDFHALVASKSGVVGFDGTLRATDNGTTWRSLNLSVPPTSLAASPDGRVLLAASARGLMRSADAGTTWAAVKQAPALLLVSWAKGAVVAGVSPLGTVVLSRDAGLTWERRGEVRGMPQALGAHASPEPQAGIGVLIATDTEVLKSTDSGTTFTPAI